MIFEHNAISNWTEIIEKREAEASLSLLSFLIGDCKASLGVLDRGRP